MGETSESPCASRPSATTGSIIFAKPRAASWQLYVLHCADGTLYTGITTDLERRLGQHQAGTGARYTRGRRPVRCVVSWSYPDRSWASRAEHAFKQLDRARKLDFIARPGAWAIAFDGLGDSP